MFLCNARFELTEEMVDKRLGQWATLDLTGAYSSDAVICGHGFCLNGIDEINKWAKGFESNLNVIHLEMFDIDVDKETNSFFSEYIYYFNVKGDGCNDDERSIINRGYAIGRFNSNGLIEQQNFHSNFQDLMNLVKKCDGSQKKDL